MEALSQAGKAGSPADCWVVISDFPGEGSEWEKVLAFEERFPFSAEDHKRWLYTVITRASDKLVIVKN